MAKQEILPPERRLPTRPHNRPPAPLQPRINTGGPIASTLTRWEAQWQSRAIGALTNRTRAEAALYDAQTGVLDAYGRRAQAAQRVSELPELLAFERTRRHLERTEEIAALHHTHSMAAMQRETERAHKEAALVDAHQVLRAQREFGYAGYELDWKRKTYEAFGVELTPAERRQIIGQYLPMPDSAVAPHDAANRGDIDDALYEARAELAAQGLNTSRIDDIISRRR